MMARSFCLLLALLASTQSALAQSVTTIRSSGPSSNRVDLVVLGDGYTAADIASGKYANDVLTLTDGLLAQEPYREYRSYFNVHRVDVASLESGIDHPPNTLRNTAFDGAYGCGGIQRLVCVDVGKVNAVLSASIPNPSARDTVLVIVNDTDTAVPAERSPWRRRTAPRSS